MTSPGTAPRRTKASDFGDRQLGAAFYADNYMTLPWILSGWPQAKQVTTCGGKVDLDPTLRPAVVYHGMHYWEMGRKGFGRGLVHRNIDEAGGMIVREFRIPLNLFSYGFVLQRA